MSPRRLALTLASFALLASGCHKCHTCCGIGGPCGQWNTAGYRGVSSQPGVIIHESSSTPVPMAPAPSTEHRAPVRPVR